MNSNLLTRWLPLLLWMGAIFTLSHQPSDTIPQFGVWDLLFKKGAHFGAYALLALLALRVTAVGKRPFTHHPLLFAFLITLLYAISDEFHQTFVPGRHGRFADVLIDAAGGATALLMLHFRARLPFPLPAILTSDLP